MAKGHDTFLKDEIAIASIFHTGGDHTIGNRPDRMVVVIAAHTVPVGPAHWWCRRQFLDAVTRLCDGSQGAKRRGTEQRGGNPWRLPPLPANSFCSGLCGAANEIANRLMNTRATDKEQTT